MRTPAPRALLALPLALLLTAAPARAQRGGAHDADDDDPPRATAMSERSDADDPGEMEGLTRELWAFARGTPFEDAVRHAARSRARYAAEPAVATLPTGWRLAPAGSQVAVGRLPYEAVPFAGRLVVLNDGYYHAPDESPVVTIVDPARARVEKEIRVTSLFPSAAVSPGGTLFLSGGSSDSIFQLNAQFQVVRAFAAGGYAGPIAAVDSTHLAIALLTAPDSAGSSSAGTVALLDTSTGELGPAAPAGYFPIAMRAARGKLYLALAGENAVAVYDLAGGAPRRRSVISTGRSPQSLCDDGERLYVVDSGSDEVVAVSLASDSVVARYPVRFPGPAGATVRFGSAPTSCAVSGGRLYVTAAGMNAMAVFDRGAPSGSAPLGMVPTGWYPTKVVANGGRVMVLSAKGIRARRPNPNGPQAPSPLRHSGPDYVLTLLRGSVGILADSAITPRLARWTRQVAEGAPLFSSVAGFRIPVRHVFYVVRENRSYDQVMGDLRRGDGDSTLTLFGRRVTPVGHQLARDFVTLDRFFADGEISVLGHSFTTSGYASPFLEWLGNTAYAGRYRGYPFGTVPGAYSPAYLWDGLEAKSVPYRIYGEPYYLFTRLYRLITDRYGAGSTLARRFYARSLVLADSTDRGQRFTALATPYLGRGTSPSDALRILENPDFVAGISRLFTGDSSLAHAIATDHDFRIGVATWLSHYALGYPTWDLKFSDLDRIAIWRRDFEAALAEGRVPTFNYLWLPNDHTAGANRDFLDPFQLVAQNDAALGQLVETISRSRIWDESLIIVEEDDAQNGPDHVDATRTVALLAGPWVRRGAVVSDRFDQLSALRTVELLLGLDPLNLGDAVAAPMFSAFTTRPDARPFRPARPSSYLVAADSARLDALKSAQ